MIRLIITLLAFLLQTNLFALYAVLIALSDLITHKLNSFAIISVTGGVTDGRTNQNDDAVAGLVEDATRQGQQALSSALSTLREVVEDGDAGAQFRISAARSILEYTLKLTEQHSIVTQLQALERMVKEDGR